MPRDLFDAVASRPPSVHSRRAPILSILAHGLGIAFVIVASLVGSDTLPLPHERLAYLETPIRMVDIPLPPPPPPLRTATPEAPVAPSVSPNAAPAVAPEGIQPETGIEHEVAHPEAGIVVGFGSPARSTFGNAVPEEPPPPPPRAEPVRLHSGIRAPVKLTHVAPVYPPLAQRAKIEGFVIIEATIDVQGRVSSAKVLRSIPMLDQAALDAVHQWIFTPTLLNGVPVPVIMTVTVRFVLGS